MSPAIDTYPPGPATIPENLTKPTSTYRIHAWIATAVLLLFAALYVFLAPWFAVTSWRLLAAAADAKNDDVGIAVIGGIFSAFLALFMLKGLLFVKRGGD